MTAASELSPRWYPLRPHRGQFGLYTSTARFDVVEAGRRSGKTEIVKRQGVLEARRQGPLCGGGEPWIAKYCAPTVAQSRAIFWTDLKELSRPWWARDPHETELRIWLRGGAEIWIVGLDKPQRIEGSPLDRLVVDELADVKPGAWDQHLRPALDTERPAQRPAARAWLIGVPRPGSQFDALAKLAKDPEEPDYAYHHWRSDTVLSPEKIEAARRTTDERIFRQEYCGERVSFAGAAYYGFDAATHCRRVEYDRALDLVFCFDFNVEPGIAVVVQEQFVDLRSAAEIRADPDGGPDHRSTCVIGEVHIPFNSRTQFVCEKLISDWGHHRGTVRIYGDPSGGSRHTSQESGSDWDIIRRLLRGPFPDLRDGVARSAPRERMRVNSLNARIKAADGVCRLFVNPKTAPNVVRDLEGVFLLRGGDGRIDKKGSEERGLTHCSEALGYYVHEAFPLDERTTMIY